MTGSMAIFFQRTFTTFLWKCGWQ